MTTTILSETTNNVCTITLNRPEKLNSFSGTMREDLIEALTTAGGDSNVRVIVITGAGRAFCSGGDVEYMSGLQKRGATDDFMKLLNAGKTIVTTIRAIEQPVIASVNGVAAGAGCNLALACDYRLASDTAKFAQSFVKIGLHPDWGGTYFLPRLIGPSRSLEMMMTGRLVGSTEAERIGLVDRVVAAEQLVDETRALAESLAAAPPLALRAMKRALYASEKNTLAEQVDLESQHQLAAFRSSDAAEGMAAFFEKRAPRFSGE
jgi:2-(1,2-epoxy-1,2-dihydrophenyl)acetyl-CoA isomerase